LTIEWRSTGLAVSAAIAIRDDGTNIIDTGSQDIENERRIVMRFAITRDKFHAGIHTMRQHEGAGESRGAVLKLQYHGIGSPRFGGAFLLAPTRSFE
jgi:hypothetical protein